MAEHACSVYPCPHCQPLDYLARSTHLPSEESIAEVVRRMNQEAFDRVFLERLKIRHD